MYKSIISIHQLHEQLDDLTTPSDIYLRLRKKASLTKSAIDVVLQKS